MNIEGTYTLQASQEEVWRCLMDQQVLRHTIPGVERLEPGNGQAYEITMHIGQEPLVGTYHGHMIVTGEQFPDSYDITIDGEGRQGTISGQGTIHLNRLGDNTVVAYSGKLSLGKSKATVPTSVVKGAIKLMLEQFFTSLAEYLRTVHATESALSEERQAGLIVEPLEEEEIAVLAAVSPTTLLHTCVRILGLGNGDPLTEDQWVHRLRRIGITAGLLLLVWVGTRLPRKSNVRR